MSAVDLVAADTEDVVPVGLEADAAVARDTKCEGEHRLTTLDALLQTSISKARVACLAIVEQAVDVAHLVVKSP